MPQTQRAWAAIAAATVLTLPLGSIYAFSVFLKPIEAALGIPRAGLSFVFGAATVCYIVGMNLAPLLFRLASPAWLTVACGLLGAAGIGIAAAANGLVPLLLGYSVMFGIAGGAAYIILQQGANLLVTSRRGLLNGYVLSLYPGGAMIAAPLFGWGIAAFGYSTTLWGLSATLAVTGLVAAALTVHAGSVLPGRAGSAQAPRPPGAQAPRPPGAQAPRPPGALPPRAGGMLPGRAERQFGLLLRLWALFFLAAAAGLTVLSQAVGVIAAYGGDTATALAATTGITAVIAAARVTGGWLTDRFPVPFVGAFAHAVALSGTALLTLFPSPLIVVVSLGLIGAGYGLISGCTVGAITIYWVPAAFGWAAGRVYIAWCVAAVTLPVLAGHLYDLTHGYETTFMIAGCGNLLGVVVALGLPRGRPVWAQAGAG
jgi:MFS transporter, OFA family, oxalate/formate antiporter